MTHQEQIKRAVDALMAAKAEIRHEIQNYPTPVSGCDAQYNHLISLSQAVTRALDSLLDPPFVATPRTLTPGSGVESR